jgi:type VI secretion system protein ImpE
MKRGLAASGSSHAPGSACAPVLGRFCSAGRLLFCVRFSFFDPLIYPPTGSILPSKKLYSFDQSIAQQLAETQQSVRNAPTDGALRTFLFQLYAISGAWEKAVAQLQAAAQFDATAIPMAQLYREAIRCEMIRTDVFAGTKTPGVLSAPESWVGYLSEALSFIAQNKFAEAASLREKAFDLAPTSSGQVGETAFEWFADADSRLGPICEAFVNGQYYWLPFSHITSIKFETPVDLRDLVWTPAVITLRNGGQHPALIPTRYPTSENEADEFALSKKTSWVEHANDTWIGLGQRMFATDAGEFAQLDIRQITFDAA